MGRRKGAAVAQGKNRAASSSSAQELLSRQGLQTGFIGFSGSRVTAVSTPQLDGDLQMAFKRISKKDVTTKLKAFASLQELASEKSLQTILACLQSWVSAFKALPLAHDRRVRCAGLQVHEIIVARLGKAIAPELKKMAGAWILLMHDPHRDCRDAALKAFSAAFPQEKHRDTWLFCKTQVMATIEDRLKQQPDTLSDMRRVNPTEAKDVWIRNLTCAMAAACQLLGLMDAAMIEKLREKWTALFSTDFWKLFSHKVPTLRRQAYITLRHIIASAPYIVEGRLDKTAGNVLTMLREQDTQCVIAMVPTVTAFFSSFPNGTAGVKDQQLHQARGYLMKLFEAAAFGSAASTYPDMLALVDCLPKTLQGPQEKFYASVSAKVWVGANCKYAQAIDTRKASLSLFCQVINKRAGLEREEGDVEKAYADLVTSTLVPCEDFLGPSPRFPASFFFEAFCGLLAALHNSAEAVFDQVLASVCDLVLLSLNDETRTAVQHQAVATFAVTLFERTQSTLLATRIVDAALSKKDSDVSLQMPAIGLLMALASLLRSKGPSSDLVAHSDEEVMRGFVLPLVRQGNVDLVHLHWICQTARCRFVTHSENDSDASRLEEASVMSDWRALVSAVLDKASDKCSAALCLVNAICEPLHKNSALRCEQLNDAAKLTVCGTPCDNPDKTELLSLLLTGGSASTEPLLPADAIVSLLDTLRTFMLDFHLKEPNDANFSLPEMQAVLNVLSVMDKILESSHFTTCFIKEQEECLLVVFRLRACVKYYWKGLSYSDGRLSADETSSQGLVVANASAQVQRSPIASEASFIWDSRFATFSKQLVDDEGDQAGSRMSSSLIALVHQALQETPSAWFDAALYAHQALAIVDAASATERNDVLSMLLFEPDVWIAARRSLSLISFMDLNKEPLSVVSVPLAMPAEDRGLVECLYPRLIRFSLALTNLIGMEECLGHGEWRRFWFLREMAVSKVLARDAIMPPVGHGSDADDEWSIAFELLSEASGEIDSSMARLSDLPELAKETTQLVESVLSIINESSDGASYVDVYALALLMHKIISGDEEKAAWAWTQFMMPLTDALLSGVMSGGSVTPAAHSLWVAEAIGPEIVAAINPLAFEELGLQKVQKMTTEALFAAKSAEDVTIVASTLATLIHTPRLTTIDASSEIAVLLTSVVMHLQSLTVESTSSNTALCRLLAAVCHRADARDVVVDQLGYVFSFCHKVLEQCSWEGVGHERLIREAILLLKAANSLFEDEEHEDIIVRCIETLFALFMKSRSGDVRQPTVSLLLLPLCHTVTRGVTRRPALVKSLVAADLDALYKMLAFPHVEVQKAACLLLTAYLQAAPCLDAGAIRVSDEEEDGVLCLLPPQLKQILEERRPDDAGEEADEDEDLPYVYRPRLQQSVRSMLAWCLVIVFFGKQEMKVRRIIGAWFRRSEAIFRFLSMLFDRIMLGSPSQDPQPSQDVAIAAFDPTYEESLERFMAEMYLSMLGTLPSLVRSWWNDCCGKVRAQDVLQFTAKFISPVLCAREVTRCAELEEDLDDFEISGNVRASEVTAVYMQDDAELSMTLHLPSAFPLQSVEVTCSKSLVMKAPERKRWTLTLHRILMTQDASILDAVMLWRDNMEKKFEGVESCLICYSVFHDSNSSLSNLTCKTCSNKFHSACLYKWFNTSHKSNCPLCQTPWIE